jgi:uncharacterized BrkB/YihY/UPF0761 family membrane protein
MWKSNKGGNYHFYYKKFFGILMIIIGLILMVFGSAFAVFGYLVLFSGQLFMVFFLLLPTIIAVVLVIFGSKIRKNASFGTLKCHKCGFKMKEPLIYCPKCGEFTLNSLNS